MQVQSLSPFTIFIQNDIDKRQQKGLLFPYKLLQYYYNSIFDYITKTLLVKYVLFVLFACVLNFVTIYLLELRLLDCIFLTFMLY